MKYAVADLGLVAFLTLRGFRQTEVEVDGRRCIFLFSESPEIREAQRAYEADSTEVPPQRFYKALRAIRVLTADIKAHAQPTTN